MKALFSILFIATVFSCNAQKSDDSEITMYSENLEVYYFHFKLRCMACTVLEEEAIKNVETIYPDLYKQGKIRFIAVNLDEPEGRKTGEKIGENMQALVLVKGNQKVNLTTEGFLYAAGQPEKFKGLMKEKFDNLLNL